MSAYRKVVIARSLLLAVLVAAAFAFAVAVAFDADDGGVLDDQGVVDQALLETAPGGG